jgi:hypothetical protein
MKRKTDLRKTTPAPDNEKAEQKNQTTNSLLEEDAVQTTAYLANAAGSNSPTTKLDNMFGMLGADVTDESLYHKETQPTMKMG